MKKISILFIAIALLLGGCGSANSGPDTTADRTSANGQTNEGTSGATDEQSNGYVFEYKGIPITVHAEVAPILQGLGEEMSYFEAESCALPGMEKTYTYNGFEILTYELNGVDYVQSVILLDDSVQTKEGVTLFDGLDEVIQAYGDNYTKNFGLYSYEIDGCMISLLVENDEVTSIEYVALHN